MDYPFLIGAAVLGLVWLVGAGVERFHAIAKPAAVLATVALIAHAVWQLLLR